MLNKQAMETNKIHCFAEFAKLSIIIVLLKNEKCNIIELLQTNKKVKIKVKIPKYKIECCING